MRLVPVNRNSIAGSSPGWRETWPSISFHIHALCGSVMLSPMPLPTKIAPLRYSRLTPGRTRPASFKSMIACDASVPSSAAMWPFDAAVCPGATPIVTGFFAVSAVATCVGTFGEASNQSPKHPPLSTQCYASCKIPQANLAPRDCVAHVRPCLLSCYQSYTVNYKHNVASRISTQI